jgi:hypothetical protein
VSTHALRAALIWHDEVMDDVVLDTPRAITIGHTGKSTFTIPEVGLPPEFAIVRPGNRGYLLTLGERMRGTICVDGVSHDVAEFVSQGDGETLGGFRATPIGGRDWGVIDLDESGHCKLYFQFVPVQAPLDTHTDMYVSLTHAAAAALLTSLGLVVLAANWPWLRHQGWAEWLFRSVYVVYVGVILFSWIWWLVRAEPEQQASHAFSGMLHGVLLGWVIVTWTGQDPYVWPGPLADTGNYLVSRLEPEPPPEPTKAVATVASVKQEAAAKNPNKENLKTATKGDQGAAGGKGEKERARDPNAKEVPPEPPKVALMQDKTRHVLDNVIADRSLETNLGKFTGIKGDRLLRGSVGFGPGTGSGVGEGIGTGTTRGSHGHGHGGGGNVEGDFVTAKGPIDTGTQRPGGKCKGPHCHGAAPKEVKLAIQGGSGDFGGYTEDEINRVVKSRAGIFRACYQRELNRTPGLGGKLVIHFRIGADGMVKSAAKTGSSSLTNAAVESCVKSNVMRLKFPPKGAIANVTYPFVFSQGG